MYQRNWTALAVGQHVIEIDGVCQAYEVAGSGPVCLVHSGGPSFNSHYLRMPLLEQDLTMVYLDPIGTGLSDMASDGDYSVSTYARFSEGVIKHLGVDRPFFIGHSHGGFVGLELAIRDPGLLGGLVAYGTAAMHNAELLDESTRQMADFAERWRKRPEAAEAARTWDAHMVKGTEKAIDRVSCNAFLEKILPAFFADFRRTIGGREYFALDVTYDPARKNGEWDARGRLGKVDVPTLVISGRHDVIFPLRWSEQLVAEIPDARMLVLDESGHLGHLESEQKFARAVRTFIDGRSERRFARPPRRLEPAHE